MKSRKMPGSVVHAANTGAAWERVLEAAAAWTPGLVLVRTAPDERRGRKGPVDFLGVWPGGRALAVEAKDCTGSAWPLAKLAPHQQQLLDDVHRAGGVALLALRVQGAGWLLPWPVVADAIAATATGGRASVTAEGLGGGTPWTRGWSVAPDPATWGVSLAVAQATARECHTLRVAVVLGDADAAGPLRATVTWAREQVARRDVPVHPEVRRVLEAAIAGAPVWAGGGA